MFERFTDRARRVIVLAQEEAKMLNHNYIGTEHLLLGLIHEADGIAAKVLLEVGVSLDVVREILHDQNPGAESQPVGHIPFTPRAKKVLDLALREALAIEHQYISTEHILLGLLREGEGVAANVLTESLKIELDTIRSAVFVELGVAEADRPVVSATDDGAGVPVVSFGELADNQMMVTIDDPSGVVEITSVSVTFRDSNGERCHAKWPADD